MSYIEKIYALHRALRDRRTPVRGEDLQERLGLSRTTFFRVLRELEAMGAPIVNERGRGYRYDKSIAFELPGVWFNAAEMHALLAFRALLHDIQPGLLDDEIEPVREKIEKLLAGRAAGHGELERRIRILGMAAREPGEHFRDCASALAERKRLVIDYHGRSRNEITHRHISPQRLTHYRDAWYLDAWCHEVRGLRTFAVERIRAAKILDKPAKEISETRLDRHYATAYGIFAGKPRHTAVLRFSPAAARWVADERWHPKQRGKFLADGSYELRIPYGEPTELVMDILKHGPDVQVLAPPELRARVAQRLREAAGQYRTNAFRETERKGAEKEIASLPAGSRGA